MQKNIPCPICSGGGQYCYSGKDFLYNLGKKYDYCYCAFCGTVYQTPMPTQEEIGRFYPDDYEVHKVLDRHKQLSFSKKAVLKWNYGYSHLELPWITNYVSLAMGLFRYKDQIEYQGGGKALDIGCANGKYVRYLEELGWHAEGVDSSSNAIEACRSIGITAHHGTLESMKFENESYALITARHVIEHIRDPHSFAKEINRLLMKHGRLMIRTPNSHSFGHHLFGVYWYQNDIPRHLILYSLQSLDLLFGMYGLKRVKAMNFSSHRNISRSIDYAAESKDKPIRNLTSRLLFMKLFRPLIDLCFRGDELYIIYQKSHLSG